MRMDEEEGWRSDIHRVPMTGQRVSGPRIQQARFPCKMPHAFWQGPSPWGHGCAQEGQELTAAWFHRTRLQRSVSRSS